MVKSSCFVLFSRRKLGHKTTFLQKLTYVACSIFANRDPFNKKQSLYTSIICRYLSYVAEQSAFKRPRLKVFKSSTPTKILLYGYIHVHVSPATLRFAFTANVKGKKYHVIMIFPPFFKSAVCCLPFSTRRGLISRSSTT